jgi:superfamily II DNA or RNA helicase
MPSVNKGYSPRDKGGLRSAFSTFCFLKLLLGGSTICVECDTHAANILPHAAPISMYLNHDARFQITEAFGVATMNRAMDIYLCGDVGDLDIDDDDESIVTLAAFVQGSAKKPYRTRVQLQGASSGRARVSSFCTCPVGDMCKHAAAMVMEWMDDLDEMGEATMVRPSTPATAVIEPAALTYPIEQWLSKLKSAETRELTPQKPRAATPEKYIAYRLKFSINGEWTVLAQRATPHAGFSKPNFTTVGGHVLHGEKAPSYIDENDLEIVKLWPGAFEDDYIGGEKLVGKSGEDLLARIMSTGRAYLHNNETRALRWGEAAEGLFTWEKVADPRQGEMLQLKLSIPNQKIVAPIRLGHWYWINPKSFEIGILNLPVSQKRAALLLEGPPVPRTAIDLLADAIPQTFASQIAALPTKRTVNRIEVAPIPVLELAMETIRVEEHALQPLGGKSWKRSYKQIAHKMPIARVWFDYGPHRFALGDDGQDLILTTAKDITRVVRDRVAEEKHLKALEPARLFQLRMINGVRPSIIAGNYFGKAPHNPEKEFFDNLRRLLPSLIDKGWRFESPGEFGVAILRPEDGSEAIELTLKPAEEEAGKIDWFDLHIGTRIDGQEFDLAPAIMAWLKSLKPGARVERIEALLQPEASRGEVLMPLIDGRLIALDPARLRPILEALLKLFSPREITDGDTGLSGTRLAELSEIDGVASPSKDWINGSKGARLAHALATWSQRPPTKLPPEFKADLRPYQHEGLDWLQLLFMAGMGGCLADDMGLGKTVQTLAHIAVLKANGQLSGPVLIVAPTSVVPNWGHEIERFAPGLGVVNFTGLERAGLADQIESADVVLSSYALLSRDIAVLGEQAFSLVVLDEAQNIRNPATVAAKAAVALNAEQKIALSGTPVENHLGDLWSMMRFLNPGLLGDNKQFGSDFRKPIEKDNEPDAKRRLARRIKPFMLRRTKEQVAKDLPDRTELIADIELYDTQRDLYEVTRAAMQRRVIEAMGAKGLAQSAIVIIDALLKLRQCCCDPRLVKTATKTATSGGSAKLDHLIEMLKELNAEGRRVLVFSQFTSMLDLIEEQVKALGFSYERLTGETRDRDGPVKRFQSGQSDVFLISTKAGGVGLNLTAADTVILYDPWWNPAVEAQAIGRAHRIGQQRPVFVHRLICAGTIEEKMLALQARKKSLAGSLFNAGDDVESTGAKAVAGLSEADILGLFD